MVHVDTCKLKLSLSYKLNSIYKSESEALKQSENPLQLLPNIELMSVAAVSCKFQASR